jgi:hypothetical protein
VSLAITPGSLNLCASIIDVAHTAAAAAGAACCRLLPPVVLYALSMLSAAALAMMAVTAALLLPLLLLLLLLLLLPLLPVLLLLLSSKVDSRGSFATNGALLMLGQVEAGGLWGCGACRAAASTQEWIWSGVGLQDMLLLSSCNDRMTHSVLSYVVRLPGDQGRERAEQLLHKDQPAAAGLEVAVCMQRTYMPETASHRDAGCEGSAKELHIRSIAQMAGCHSDSQWCVGTRPRQER